MNNKNFQNQTVINNLLRCFFNEILDKIIHDIQESFNQHVTEFYNDYEPVYYIRFGDPVRKKDGLYNALQIQRDGLNFSAETSPDNLPNHKQNNRIVYRLNIKLGIHGGIQTIRSYSSTPITKPSVENYMRAFWSNYKNNLLTDNAFISIIKKYRRKINEIRRGV